MWSVRRQPPPCAPAVPKDLEQFGFLGLDVLVHLGGVTAGELVQLLLGTPDVVLARLAIFCQLVERVLGVAADGADRHLRVLALATRDLHHLLAAFLGELGEHHADDLSVIGRVHPEIAVADRTLDRGELI